MHSFFNLIGLTRNTFSSGFTPLLAILIISVTTVTPIFFNELYVMPLWIMFFLVEIGIIFRSERRLGTLLVLGIAFIFICAIYAILGISSASMAYCIHNPLMFFAPVLALIVIDRCDNDQQIRFLFHAIALAIAINIADNIWLTYDIGLENIVYQRLAGMMEEEGLTGLNLGGAGFVNLTVFYACAMFMAFLKSDKREEKLLFLVYVGISVYFVVFCSLKASALLLMLLTMALMLVSVKSKKSSGMAFFFIIVGGGLVYLFRDDIINFLIDVIDSGRIKSRLILFTSAASIDDNNTFISREELWFISIESWLSSARTFFFGIGDHNWHQFLNTAESGIGNHSDMFDVLGRYGIIGALVLYSSIKVYYDYLQRRFCGSFKLEVITFVFLLLAIGFTKRFLTAQQAIAVFILFPLTLRYFYNQKTI